MGNLKPLREPSTEVDVDTLLARLTADRAGYLDQLDFDLQENLNVIDGNVDNILTETGTHPTLGEIEASALLALKAHLVNGTGDIIPPDNKGIWDYLPFLTADVATEAKQDVIDDFHDVPGEDSATDAQMRDVVGKKSD
ncbi:unnamed protein product, partial [marine sediment metagenome]